MLRKQTVTFSSGLNILGFVDNRSNSAQESSANEDSNDSNNDFSANELSASKKMAQHVVSHEHIAPEEVFQQGHMINRNISIQQTQK